MSISLKQVAASKPSRMGRRRLDEGPALSRERLIDAVLRLAETEGQAAINMRRVAAVLGVSSRLLYRHIKDKAELLELLADSIAVRIPLPQRDGPWDQRLLEIARSTRAVISRYPGVPHLALINSTQNLNSPHIREITEVIRGTLREAGLDEAHLDHAYIALSAVTMGHLMIAQAYAGKTGDRVQPAFDSGKLEDGFETALAIVINGIKAMVAKP